MFSTILDNVTSYFDKRALVSSFFPSLVFWALVVAAFIVLQMDWRSVLNAWDKLSGTMQFLLLFAFFVWVTFWSFLTINFRMAFTRLFEGYWPHTKPFDRLITWRCGYWQNRWSTLNHQDKELETQEATLLAEQIDYKQLRASLASGQISPVQTATADADKIGQELDAFLSRLEARLDSSTANPPNPLTTVDLRQLGQETRIWWVKFSPWFGEAEQNKNDTWAHRYNRLEKITKQLSEEVDQQHDEVQEQRQAFYRNLSLYYPPEQNDIMPTRLGNVLKASELYSWKRYHLDAVIIWSRLQSGIPDAFSTTLQDAKTSLDFMTTLSAFILLFGLPVAIWIAVKTTVFLPWWIPLILTLVALSLRLFLPAGVAALTLILALILTFAIPRPALLLLQLQVLLILLVGISLLFWMCYQNAVQAALSYGEKIKSAIDLYRWQVLEGLHLQLPKDFEEERKIWEMVEGLLARNYSPDSRYYRYVQQEKTDKKDPTSS